MTALQVFTAIPRFYGDKSTIKPERVARFKAAFPKVHLVLRQGSPAEIATLLHSGEADIGIATEALDDVPQFVTFPFYSWHHAVVVPDGHALADLPELTLEALAERDAHAPFAKPTPPPPALQKDLRPALRQAVRDRLRRAA